MAYLAVYNTPSTSTGKLSIVPQLGEGQRDWLKILDILTLVVPVLILPVWVDRYMHQTCCARESKDTLNNLSNFWILYNCLL